MLLHDILRRVAPIAIAVAALSACNSDAPLAPERAPLARASATTPSLEKSQEQATVPFSFVQYASCANGGQGELLWANGELSYRGQWATSNDGQRHHTVVNLRFVGSAIGTDTGEEYDVVTRELSQGNIAEGTDGILDSGEELQRTQLRLTSRATGAVIDIVLTMHFVETPTGEYVQDEWDARTRCR
jgi:hypothetical protein